LIKLGENESLFLGRSLVYLGKFSGETGGSKKRARRGFSLRRCNRCFNYWDKLGGIRGKKVRAY